MIERMTRIIDLEELRDRANEVIDAVAAGECFVVNREGVPVAEIRPPSGARRTFISRDEIRALSGPGARIDRELFRGDLDEVVDQRW